MEKEATTSKHFRWPVQEATQWLSLHTSLAPPKITTKWRQYPSFQRSQTTTTKKRTRDLSHSNKYPYFQASNGSRKLSGNTNLQLNQAITENGYSFSNQNNCFVSRCLTSHQMRNATYFWARKSRHSTHNEQFIHPTCTESALEHTSEWVYTDMKNKKGSMFVIGNPTWYPRRAKYFSFSVFLEICSVLSIWTPKNTALIMFKISPTWNNNLKLLMSVYLEATCEALKVTSIKFNNNDSSNANAYAWRRSTGFQHSNPYERQDSSKPGKGRHFCS